ncbi:CPBP family intramembrane glutamic endopeptidase [Ruminococcus sp.]|uniref:CPBP family intramembrane glutamic endopeptidase n=1 Tax=Ruminococcus sp. TaxID=41978 RepID=UPI0025FC2C47|nr:CPBP family intramembrane glutamic endopeptidase [Ruminococcus sp.]MBQ8965790.1 CPBP family intramembrane metalloprotease [Ruminococcus sp.]
MAGKNDYIKDVARERTYQNQNKAYDEAYFKWRSDESNQYSFNYVHDTREHSYMAGRGFIKRGADTAEQATLHNCLRLLGAVMLVMISFDAIAYLFSVYFNNGMPCNAVYFSEKSGLGTSDLTVCLMYAGINVLKYLSAILIYHVRTKLPLEVALPRGRETPVRMFNMNAVTIMLMIIVIGRLSNYALSRIFGLVSVDSVYIYMFNNGSTAAVHFSLVYNCIVLPVFCEIFFRGLVLQSFRQFGDSFAVIVSAVACGLSFYDLSYMGFAILCSVVIGVFTVRSGSILTAILMHSISTLCNYLLIYAGLVSSSAGRALSITVYLIICAAAIAVYSKLNSSNDWSFNIERSESELPFLKKLQLMLSSNTVALWFVCAVVMILVTMRFTS